MSSIKTDQLEVNHMSSFSVKAEDIITGQLTVGNTMTTQGYWGDATVYKNEFVHEDSYYKVIEFYTSKGYKYIIQKDDTTICVENSAKLSLPYGIVNAASAENLARHKFDRELKEVLNE